MKLKRLKPNVPHRGHGLMGPAPARMAPLSAGEHAPQRIDSGYDDRTGYKDVRHRRDGRHTGLQQPLDTRRRDGVEGNSRGSPPPGISKGKGVRGTPDSHLGIAGRGGSGRVGKHDNYKGRATAMNEAPGHEWFERLGSD